MKQILTGLALLIIVNGCKNGMPGSPKSSVESFIEAAKNGNFDEVKKYITKSDVSLIEMGQSVIANFDPARAKEMKDKMSAEFKEKTKDARIEIKDETIDGNNATVNVEFNHDGKSETHPFSLLKEDGQWKISLISTGMKNSGANQQDAGNTMKNMNADSLQALISKSMKEGMKEFDKIDKDSLKQAMKAAMKEVNRLDNDSLKKAIKEGMKELEKLKEIPKKD